ncbi:dr1-associated corepressor-like [Sinocyclocheilus rhinocerous]|uniref:dr1-associated corepressor-like n=1 Tax=Sinocyclocheilus rhinocerous TaxID=307959 RepID=UPI0007BA8853|nr:PREDICTED: dr1-associated corepressor-like [Sinocyclocheilus rhinocerous]XP_016382383.1 PREDICTED: dr1-associated corepressor-like [Sinocyclocheilus rhinocerous]
MPGQKRKYNVRFPAGRIKKIMQKDTEVGRIATAVPVIISKALEMFLRSLLTMTCKISQSRNSRVMSINHMKQCIHSEKLFDFLKDLADQASTASTSECKTKGKWQSHRKRWQSVSIKARSPEREEPPQKATNDLVINSDSSSESELFICLETHSP